MLRKGYTTTKVLDADRVALARSQIDMTTARTKHDVLEGYTHRRQLAELEANVAFHEREIGRVKLRSQAALTQRERTFLARKRALFQEGQRLQKVQAQIAACTIRSPREGMVVFANTLEGGRSSSTPLIYEGATVRERQPLVQLPDLTHMRVNARIHESKIAMLREGLEVTVQVDALKGELFHGIVDVVAPVPNSASWPNVNLKEYMTAVKLTDDVPSLAALKPGMTAEVEILVDRLESVVQAPIQACVERGGRYFAWVVEDESEFTRHEIQLGRSNDTDMEVIAGLDEGDAVVLNPRSVLPDEIALLEQEIALTEESIWAHPPAAARPRETDAAPAKPPRRVGSSPRERTSAAIARREGPRRADPDRGFDPGGKRAIGKVGQPGRPDVGLQSPRPESRRPGLRLGITRSDERGHGPAGHERRPRHRQSRMEKGNPHRSVGRRSRKASPRLA